jgi:hypothetical protein
MNWFHFCSGPTNSILRRSVLISDYDVPAGRRRLVQYFINSSTMIKMDIDYFDRFLHSLRSVKMTI